MYLPNQPSVFRDYVLWRNGDAGWTGTVIGQVVHSLIDKTHSLSRSSIPTAEMSWIITT
jgi:hypothetical protein